MGVRVAPAHDEPRSEPNNSERGSTSGHSTNYGSGHLIRVFRDIGRIFSLLVLLSHPSPVGHPLRVRVQMRKTKYGFVEGKKGFNCVSCGTRPGGRAGACHSPKREPRPIPKGGVSGTLMHGLGDTGPFQASKKGAKFQKSKFIGRLTMSSSKLPVWLIATMMLLPMGFVLYPQGSANAAKYCAQLRGATAEGHPDCSFSTLDKCRARVRHRGGGHCYRSH